LFAHEAFKSLAMVQDVVRPATDDEPEIAMRTTRCPIRIDGELYLSSRPAPRIGEHNRGVIEEFGLESK
jgi:crotonobetainyl-CoA:carnitine CoA-transferase CaiB-like acyl-CoA transferase